MAPTGTPPGVFGLALAIAQQFIGDRTPSSTTRRRSSSSPGCPLSAITQALSVGITNVIFTIVAIVLLNRVGRRLLLIVGTAGCILSLALLGVFFSSSSLHGATTPGWRWCA